MTRWMRLLIFAGLALFAIYGLTVSRNSQELAPGPRTQIVLQWLIDSGEAQAMGLDEVFRIGDTLTAAGPGVFEVDGNDYGSGTANIFLFATEPDKAVKRVIELYDAGKLHRGMRIGVAKYTNPERTEWVYTPVYPAGLASFEITYKK